MTSDGWSYRPPREDLPDLPGLSIRKLGDGEDPDDLPEGDYVLFGGIVTRWDKPTKEG